MINRRRFIHATGGAVAALGTAGVWSRLRAEQPTAGVERAVGWGEWRRTEPALGAQVSITVQHASRETAEAALEAAFDELRLVERLMSIYQPESQLSQLNREGVLDHPHPHLVAVLREAMRFSRLTRGAFDVTVQPLWSLYADAKRANRLPTAHEITAAVDNIDWRKLRVGSERIELRGRGMQITLNGIAQGYAADCVAAALRRHGIVHALVDSGEVGAIGRQVDGQDWRVGIQHPRREDAYISLARLAGRCLATSGDYATSFTEDYRAHHIFDPGTGSSPSELASVSVLAPTATQADALSTAIFVLGIECGGELLRTQPAVDMLLVSKQGRTLASAGFKT